MHSALVIASALSVFLGCVHSVLGEYLIFRHWRAARPAIARRHQNIIWASWHVATCVAFAMAALLYHLASMPILPQTELCIAAFSLALAGALVAYGTKLRHPGWVVLWAIAGLIGAAIFGQ